MIKRASWQPSTEPDSRDCLRALTTKLVTMHFKSLLHHKAKKDANNNDDEEPMLSEYILTPAQTSYLPTVRDVQTLLQNTYDRVYTLDDIQVCPPLSQSMRNRSAIEC